MPRTRLILAVEPVLSPTVPEARAEAVRTSAHNVVTRAALRMTSWTPSAEPPMATVSADGRRMLLVGPSPRLALRACLYLRANHWVWDRNWDLRIGAGIGAANLVGDIDLRFSGGPAFDAAEAALRGLGRVPRMAPGWPEPPSHAVRSRALFALTDALARRWTTSQAELARDLLLPEKEALDRFAEETGRARRSVARSWEVAGGWALEEALASFEGDGRR